MEQPGKPKFERPGSIKAPAISKSTSSTSIASLSGNVRSPRSPPIKPHHSIRGVAFDQKLHVPKRPPATHESVFVSDEVKESHLESFALTLANKHTVERADQASQKGALFQWLNKDHQALLFRLSANEKLLNEAYELVCLASSEGRLLTSAEEWMIENYWLITEHIHLAKKHFPPNYAKDLPKLTNTEHQGLPRVWGIVIELIKLVNAQVNEKKLNAFISNYQRRSPMTLGELWAVPIMVRLGLITTIAAVAQDIIVMRKDGNAAHAWADKLIAGTRGNDDVINILYQMSHAGIQISNHFALAMAQRLQGADPILSIVTAWLEQQLSLQGQNLEEVFNVEKHHNNHNVVRLRNSIISLRYVNHEPWPDFVESQSYVEKILRSDPLDLYSKQDFESRDACRHAVERMAKGSKLSELEVAEAALGASTESHKLYQSLLSQRGKTDYEVLLQTRRAYIGYWLAHAVGSQELREKMGWEVSWREKLSVNRNFIFSIYVGVMMISTLAFVLMGLNILFPEKCSIGSSNSLLLPADVTSSALKDFAHRVLATLSSNSVSSMLLYCLLVFGLTLVGSQLGVSIANFLAVRYAKPKPVFRRDFSQGVPDDHRTIVVVPTLLTSVDNAKQLASDLQARYLVNRDKNIFFALLTDFADAPTEHAPNDALLLRTLIAEIKHLNATYPNEKGCARTFMLFHRPRLYNPKEGCWLAWERKRGKLQQFTHLLRGGTSQPFSYIDADPAVLQTIQYVITLDVDTMLPCDSARKLAGAAAHVMNKPVVDPHTRIVTAGYGLLQPRVSLSMKGRSKSLYAYFNSWDTGLDPYTKYVSDVYQDLFGEGSFIGKGLYHVDAFEDVFANHFPENRILSHDLIEGCYCRSGLISDVDLVEEYPSSYLTEASRRHRWVRGDWQIGAWLLPWVPHVKGYVRNQLSIISKWKIFDNLRRSLFQAALAPIVIFSFLFAPFSSTVPLQMLALLTSPWSVPMLASLYMDLTHKPPEVEWKMHLKNVRFAFWRSLVTIAVELVFVPFEAQNNLDAIVRCLVRMHITGKKLLEWTTSTAAASMFSGHQLLRMVRQLWFGPFFALASIGLLGVQALFAAMPADPSLANASGELQAWMLRSLNTLIIAVILLTWLASPVISWYISAPLKKPSINQEQTKALDDEQRQFLHCVSRKTWRFFEKFVREEDHYLPLDNFQDFPLPQAARRTSPTNLGLALLANLAAWDFGYVTLSRLIERSQKALTNILSLERMDKTRQFFNWYSTENKQALYPRYVSSVDSGNLLAMAVILKTGFIELGQAQLIRISLIKALRDGDLLCVQNVIDSLNLDSAPNNRRNPADDSGSEYSGGADELEIWRRLRDQVDELRKYVLSAEQMLDDEGSKNLLPTALLLQEKMLPVIKAAVDNASELEHSAEEKDPYASVSANDDSVLTHGAHHETAAAEALYYLESFAMTVQSLLQELGHVTPWLGLIEDIPEELQNIKPSGPAGKSDAAPKATPAPAPAAEEEKKTEAKEAEADGKEATAKPAPSPTKARAREKQPEQKAAESKDGSSDKDKFYAQVVTLLKNLQRANLTLAEVAEMPNMFNALWSVCERNSGFLSPESKSWLADVGTRIKAGGEYALRMLEGVGKMVQQCDDVLDQDFRFLYNNRLNLLSIGYNSEARALDGSHYDTLCSEARLASYVLICRQQLPVKHWFSMTRLLALQDDHAALLSWSGSMFEYLMPLLLIPSVPDTILEETYRAIVKRQIEYADSKGVPWGISESAYNVMDAGLVYQYGPFGVPGLGLKRGLSNDLVIAPYASCLALMVEPVDSCENLKRLANLGMLGPYGFYESVDFTPNRLRGSIEAQPIRSWFAHHSGMSFVALNNVLLHQRMQKRFWATPELAANALLLQEKIPKIPYLIQPIADKADTSPGRKQATAIRRFRGMRASQATPDIHLLSNGRLHVMCTVNGGGYVNFNDMAVTRWREDVTLNGYGVFFYIRDIDEKKLWTTGATPILPTADVANDYRVEFSQGKAEYFRKQHEISTKMVVTVSPEDDVEVRRVYVTNESDRVRYLDVTSYGEVVLGSMRADASHRAFASLFVKAEVLPMQHAILYTRRPRNPHDKHLFAFHTCLVHDQHNVRWGLESYETDRYQFIGRDYGNSMGRPRGCDFPAPSKNRGLNLSVSDNFARSGSVVNPPKSPFWKLMRLPMSPSPSSNSIRIASPHPSSADNMSASVDESNHPHSFRNYGLTRYGTGVDAHLSAQLLDSELELGMDPPREQPPLNRKRTNSRLTEKDMPTTSSYPLDPIFAIRQPIRIEPGQTIRLDYITGVATTRVDALKVMRKYHQAHLTDAVMEFSWVTSQRLNFQLGISETDAQLFNKLGSFLLYSSPHLRAPPRLISKNKLDQSALFKFGISGDLNIMLVRVFDSSSTQLVRQCLQAHSYLRQNGVLVDLVILNEETTSYRDDLQSALKSLIGSLQQTCELLDRRGGIHLVRTEHMSERDSVLLFSVARVVLTDIAGRLEDQIFRNTFAWTSADADRLSAPPKQITSGSSSWFSFSDNRLLKGGLSGPRVTKGVPVPKSARVALPAEPPTPLQSSSTSITLASLHQRDLFLVNKLGGFNPNPKRNEYVMELSAQPGHSTPAPWCNVLANPEFGSVISEKGAAYTWFDNAHEYRLSPWNNDAVLDGSGETFYIRCDDTGRAWSPQPQPVMGTGSYVVRHGFGYSVWEHVEDGIRSDTTVFVPPNEPIKVVLIKVHNCSGSKRNLSISGFIEWCLGELRENNQHHIVTDSYIDGGSTAILARNPFNIDFNNHTAFFAVVRHKATFTADRSEFIGFNRTLRNPVALEYPTWSNKVGSALDPCAAMQVKVSLAHDQATEVVFIIGAGRSSNHAKDICQRMRSELIAHELLMNTRLYWQELLGTIRVETPDPAVNFLTNGWLLYQVIAGRLFARSGFYQSGGAFGFRDQLQDAMAVSHTAPHILRKQIITCCAHQFEAGDVFHWWHPHSNRGTRTWFSDDFLFLPFATAHYLTATADYQFLEEQVRFSTGVSQPRVGEESVFERAHESLVSASVYEHCKRAIQYGCQYGVHSLPLMRVGDWCDGMNMVGINHKGESVWLGFFLFHIMEKFVPIANLRGDTDFAQAMQTHMAKLQQAIRDHAWDGEWYKRAYYDNGEPLGSKVNDECKIDALPQSWAVISGADTPERARQALESANKFLVRRQESMRLIQLLDPPFENTKQEPGYIKSYAPGIRENGAQYTHAAIWVIWAHTCLGESTAAWDLLDLINPANHTRTADEITRYRGEPYVLAADVYTHKGHEGQAGWTWYTGSAGWCYRLIVEQLLGVKRSGDSLILEPLPRPEWNEFKVDYRYGSSVYHLVFLKKQRSRNNPTSGSGAPNAPRVPGAGITLILDDVESWESNKLPLTDDGQNHNVKVLYE